jgi:hypothetical protein
MEFLHGKISIDIEIIQDLHCTLSPCRMAASDWMKGMASHLMHASHNQWILCNFTLHDKQRGFLRLQQRKDLLQELDKLINTPPEEVPEGSRYLLELDYLDLYNTSFEHQSYWVLAMKAARRAGRRIQAHHDVSRKSQRKHFRNLTDHPNRRVPCYDFTNEDIQMEHELGLIPKHCKRTKACATNAANQSNKGLHKPD